MCGLCQVPLWVPGAGSTGVRPAGLGAGRPLRSSALGAYGVTGEPGEVCRHPEAKDGTWQDQPGDSSVRDHSDDKDSVHGEGSPALT